MFKRLTASLASSIALLIVTHHPVSAEEPHLTSRATAVLYKGAVIHGRETTLPVCRYQNPWDPGDGAAFESFFITVYEDPPFACNQKAGDAWLACDMSTFRTAPLLYAIYPRSHYPTEMEWPDGSALHGLFGLTCQHNDDPETDAVKTISVEGHLLAPPIIGDPKPLPVTLAELDGGVVQTLTNGLVRGTVKLKRNPGKWGGPKDITLAIQVWTADGWKDAAKAEFTSQKTAQNMEVSALVEPFSDVRLQVRGTYHPSDQMESYDISPPVLFVEECILDISNPDQCVE